MRLRTLIFISLLFLVVSSYGQEKERAVEFLPEVHYFDPLILDPVECQSYGALYAYWEDGEHKDLIYSPLALGFQLPIVQWDKGKHGFEIGFMGAVFFQFEFVEPTIHFTVNVINTDFKVGIPFIYRLKRFSLRTSIYHVSSHFSEEYIFRNGLSNFGENKNTYEAIDVHAAWKFDKMRYYGGVGMVFNSPYGRGIWKFQGGFLFRAPVKKGSMFNYIAGADFQVLQETNWNLNTQLGAGFELAMRPNRTFQLMIQFFNGSLPYSQYTQQKVSYLGAAIIAHPF
jgi:hypothetical protein